MNKFLKLLLIGSTLLCSVCFAQIITRAPSVTTQADTASLRLFFIQTAQTASIQPDPNKSGYYTLTLTGINPYITYFSDRPNRIKGIAPTDNFVKAWSVGGNSYAQNNPNAVITAAKIDQTINQNSNNYVVSLSSPVYDQRNLQIRYTMKPLPAENFFFKQLTFDYVVLFIDGGDMKLNN